MFAASAMDSILVSLANSCVEILAPKVFEVGPLGGGEVVRVKIPTGSPQSSHPPTV